MDLPYGKDHGGTLWGILWFGEKFGASWHNLWENHRGFILRNDYGAGLPPRLAKAYARVGQNPENGTPAAGAGHGGGKFGVVSECSRILPAKGAFRIGGFQGDGK